VLITVDAKLLGELIRASAGQSLTLWVIFIEDRYETVFGDGYFSYPQRAFFDKAVADRWAQWVTTRSGSQPNTMGFRATVQARALSPGEPVTAELIQLLNTGNLSWKTTIDCCAKQSGEDPPPWTDTIPALPREA